MLLQNNRIFEIFLFVGHWIRELIWFWEFEKKYGPFGKKTHKALPITVNEEKIWNFL